MHDEARVAFFPVPLEAREVGLVELIVGLYVDKDRAGVSMGLTQVVWSSRIFFGVGLPSS